MNINIVLLVKITQGFNQHVLKQIILKKKNNRIHILKNNCIKKLLIYYLNKISLY